MTFVIIFYQRWLGLLAFFLVMIPAFAQTSTVQDRTGARHQEVPRLLSESTRNVLKGKKVFLYTKNGEGYVHDNIAASVEAIRQLSEKHEFEITVSDDPADFTPENLRQYDVLLFSNTNNKIFDTEAQRSALQQYIRQGGGFVGVHIACGGERDWPWFAKMVGGRFVRHPERQDFDVQVLDHEHPSTSFLPDVWHIQEDECYFMDHLNPDIHVLLAADLTTVTDTPGKAYPGDTFGDRFPTAWYHEFDGGREWFTSLGHRKEHYQDSTFLKHILGGLMWTVDKEGPPESH